MNAAERTIEWLAQKQLQVGDQWSVRTDNGFTWWADKNAQTIEVVGSEQDEAGDTAYLISVRTEFLREVELTQKHLEGINVLLMSVASMCGPVYDHENRTLSICSLVRVHDGIQEWMSRLLSIAAVLQIAEARIMGPPLAELFAARSAESRHPQSGWRNEADELANIVETAVAPGGRQPCKWTTYEFEQAANEFIQCPLGRCASTDGSGIRVEFPFGKVPSFCHFRCDQSHPRYGNGLLLLQIFPGGELSDEHGARLALELNTKELAQNPSGYGFGSYCYRDNTIHFTSFLPNAAYRGGLLTNLFLTCASRASEMSHQRLDPH